jgi:competence protein ComEA
VGLILYVVQGPPGEAVVLRPPPTALPLRVHLSGGILVEGVYSLPAGSRLMDAIEIAGGLASDADPESLNLAAYLEDGDHILIPTLAVETPLAKGLIFEIQDNTESEDAAILININTADLEDLETLPGIGPVLAEEIIAYRELNGSFQNKEDILFVKGIGQVKYDQIKELITVGDVP